MDPESLERLVETVERAVGDAQPPFYASDAESAYLIAYGLSAGTGDRWRSAYDREHRRWYAAPVGS